MTTKRRSRKKPVHIADHTTDTHAVEIQFEIAGTKEEKDETRAVLDEVRNLLSSIGVRFDWGELQSKKGGPGHEDWFFDWSLSGPVNVIIHEYEK